MNQPQNQNQEESVIAIADSKNEAFRGNWQFLTFPNRDEALIAVNDARRQGKIAVFYHNGFDEFPTEI